MSEKVWTMKGRSDSKARIISRRLDKLDGRLLYIVFEVVASKINVDTIEVHIIGL